MPDYKPAPTGTTPSPRLSVDAMLAEQSRPPRLYATLEPVEGASDKVKITPWTEGAGCQCQNARVLPKDLIEGEPTSSTHLCCGKTLPVWAIHFREGASIPASELFAQMPVASPPATPSYPPQGMSLPPAGSLNPIPNPAYGPPNPSPAPTGVRMRSTCICDHYINRYCRDGQMYEDYWCYDETGAFCGTQTVPLGLPCPASRDSSPLPNLPFMAANAIQPSFAAADCTGNACGVVSVTWTGRGYDIRNNGSRRVRVRIRFAFGFSCMDPSDIDLNPGQTVSYGNGAYCSPYEANFL